MKITIIRSKDSKVKSSLVSDAVYVKDFKIKIFFKDGTNKIVDFKSFLYSEHVHPIYKRYRKTSVFKKFDIKNGNLNWNDYEMIFPVEELYNGKISM
jgi:hypothetical protein